MPGEPTSPEDLGTPTVTRRIDLTGSGTIDGREMDMARLVRTRKEGTQVIYRLENDHVRQLVTDAVFNAEHAGPGVPGHHRTGDDLRILHAERGVDPAPARTEGGRA
ncbi:hypothetical protein AIIKEEIJ_01211 [Rhodococcus sp. YH1]|nr:hypothetical protein [Rhodococcus sp. YH1]